MNNSLILRAIILFGGLSSFSALAVESPKPVIPLFNEYLATNVAGIDMPGSTNIEAVGVNQRLVIRTFADPTVVRSRMKIRLEVQDPDSVVAPQIFEAYVDTKPYPNPDTAVGTNYACEDDGYVVGVDPKAEDYPCDYDLNVGIANDGATQYGVISLAVYSWYANSTDGQVDISRGSVTVFNLTSGGDPCRGEWDVTDGVWTLEDGLSAVGDYLGNDGTDEIRIVYSRVRDNGKVEMKYTYYDISTCGQIGDVQQFKVGLP